MFGKVSDGDTWPSLLFEDREHGHKQGWPARRRWRAAERGGDAALSRSAGARSDPRRRAGAMSPGQRSAPRRREPAVPGRPQRPGARAPRRRAACPSVRGELASSAGELGRGTLSSQPGRRALGFSQRALARRLLPSFLNQWPRTLCGPDSWLDFKDAFCKSLRPCPVDSAPEALALGELGQEWNPWIWLAFTKQCSQEKARPGGD